MNRLHERYNKEISAALMKELNFPNVMMVPKLEKIVINSGVGEATQNIKVLDKVMEELATISGQKPSLRRAKKSIASFRLRAGQPIAATVTLRGERMYDFMDRFVSIVIPRMKDFRGMSKKSFDGTGNYTIAMKDQLVFPEINYSKVDKPKGMSITFVTSAKTNQDSMALLTRLGVPFR
ncbi:MAG: 50S ribosomal protein L5 [Candidatus Aminicenantes bacterium]|nr:50S ribosomal protein L5 [Acidobacteriota bacterium]MCG2810608.1 50S ribosomal protein L5 [Candidatus Aminicenantes bacterium]